MMHTATAPDRHSMTARTRISLPPATAPWFCSMAPALLSAPIAGACTALRGMREPWAQSCSGEQRMKSTRLCVMHSANR